MCLSPARVGDGGAVAGRALYHCVDPPTDFPIQILRATSRAFSFCTHTHQTDLLVDMCKLRARDQTNLPPFFPLGAPATTFLEGPTAFPPEPPPSWVSNKSDNPLA
jgi:hypothetical protein